MGGRGRGGFSLPRAARIRTREEFQYVLSASRRWSGIYVDIFVVVGKEPQRKLGIVCGRRVGKAHDRSRVKRRIREIIRTHPALFYEGCWLVVIAKPAAANATYNDLNAEITGGLKRLVQGM